MCKRQRARLPLEALASMPGQGQGPLRAAATAAQGHSGKGRGKTPSPETLLPSPRFRSPFSNQLRRSCGNGFLCRNVG
jgi:hypothetical protein